MTLRHQAESGQATQTAFWLDCSLACFRWRRTVTCALTLNHATETLEITSLAALLAIKRFFFFFLFVCADLLPLGLIEQSVCHVDQISGAYGWWGKRTLFLTSLHSCRTENYVPGLHLLTFQQPRNDSQPDKVQGLNIRHFLFWLSLSFYLLDKW